MKKEGIRKPNIWARKKTFEMHKKLDGDGDWVRKNIIKESIIFQVYRPSMHEIVRKCRIHHFHNF